MSTALLHRSRRLVVLLTAAAFVAAVSPVAQRGLAQTATTDPNDPSAFNGPPAPDSFAGDLTRIYDEATAVPVSPGTTSTAPLSSADFHQVVSILTPDQLARMYDANPTAWPEIISTIDSYAQGIAANPAPAPQAAPATEGGAQVSPEIFQPAPCPGLAFAARGGAFHERYALEVSRTQVELAASQLETVSVGLEPIQEALLALDLGPVDAALVKAVLGSELIEKALSLAAAILSAVADGIEIPIDVITWRLHQSIDSCQYDNGIDIVPAIDANEVATQHNVNASYDVAKKNFQLDQTINQLVDTRTQTIINQLNTAQTSLDQDLRHNIELALSGGNATTIVTYELPASLGGFLDATPIGVQAIVTNTMSLMRGANQPISPQAAKNLTLANNALAAGQYKQAFVYYQQTYGLLVR
jgi:hypothetical protein